MPKVRSADDVVVLAKRLEELERGSGMKPGVTKILPIATETPAGVLSLAGYARCGPRLAALTWGAEDSERRARRRRRLSTSAASGCRRIELARSLCLLAAAAAGVAAIDTPYTDFRDTEGLARQAAAARRDGFTGKLAIHPAQVDIINEAFQPDAQEPSPLHGRSSRRSTPQQASAWWRSTARCSIGRTWCARAERSSSRTRSPHAGLCKSRREDCSQRR